MVSDCPYTVLPARSDAPPSRVLIEVPHGSIFVPRDRVRDIPRNVLRSEKGYDLGVTRLALSLKWGLNAHSVFSRRGRLYIEHNRTAEHCLREIYDAGVLSPSAARERVDKHYRPYIDAVKRQIDDHFVAHRRLPIFFSIHTYEPVLHEGRRQPFNVEGEENTILVKVLGEMLNKRFQEAVEARQLTGISTLIDTDYARPVVVNSPYNLNSRLPDGTPNAMTSVIMSPNYKAGYDFPWTLLETRNDLAKQAPIQQLVLAAIKDVLADPRMQDDLAVRERAYFTSPPPLAPELGGGQQ
jgi:predicted N-formylglutamate amidohydrolase